MFARVVRPVNSAIQRRAFSVFAGSESAQNVYVAGDLVHDVQGKKVTVPTTAEFSTIPSINVLMNTTYSAAAAATPADVVSEAFLIDAKGDSAKVTSVSLEEYIKDASCKFNGPAYKWTAAKINQTYLDGTKVEIDYTFNDKDVVVKSKSTNGSKTSQVSGSLKVVSRAEFETRKNKVQDEVIQANAEASKAKIAAQKAAEKPAEKKADAAQ